MDLIGLLFVANAMGALLDAIGSLLFGHFIPIGWVCGILCVANISFFTWYLILKDRDWMTGKTDGPFADSGERLANKYFGPPD